MAHRYWVLDGGLVWPCVSVCAGTLGKVEKAWLWPWGRWEEIIGINKGPDPLISSAPVADVGRIEQFYSFSLRSASQSKGKMTIGSVFKSLMQKIIKIGSAASVVLRKMCNVRSKFCNVLCMYNTKHAMSYVEHKMCQAQCAACNRKKKHLSNAPHLLWWARWWQLSSPWIKTGEKSKWETKQNRTK